MTKKRSVSLRRLRARKARGASGFGDISKVAFALFGPVHAVVADAVHHNTEYNIQHTTGLPKRTVYAAARSLCAAGLITRDGSILDRRAIPQPALEACFGAKYAARLVVWEGVGCERHRRRRYRRRDNNRR